MNDKYKKNRGMAGTIMILLIFGLLMSISTAYMKMVQTEIEIQSMVDNSDRAVDAAFSGISYAMAIAQNNRSMFDDSVAACASRTYITSKTFSRWSVTGSAIEIPTGTLYDNPKVQTLVASVPSDWLFLNEKLTNFKIDEQTASPPYHFRVTSYPARGTTNTANPLKLIIKSQGRYLTYASDQKTVLATYSAQLIAECRVATASKRLQLGRYRMMTWENSDAKFFSAVMYD